jgi:hypothetical protein
MSHDGDNMGLAGMAIIENEILIKGRRYALLGRGRFEGQGWLDAAVMGCGEWTRGQRAIGLKKPAQLDVVIRLDDPPSGLSASKTSSAGI